MILPTQAQNLQVKPRWVAPAGIMESVVAFNCRKYGMPRPIMAMPLWEGAGNRALDLSGRGNHGTLTNGAKWAAKGVEFDGTDDCIADTITGLSNFVATVSCWIYPHTEGEGAQGRITMLQPASGWNVLFFDGGGTNRLKVGISDGTNNLTRTGTNNDITLNAWNHVAYTYDGVSGGTGIKIYVNGAEVSYSATTGTNASSASPTSFAIGANTTAGEYAFDGIIGDTSIFDTVLPARHVKFISNDPYFMYRMPEELYGYTAAVGGLSIPVAMHHYNQMMRA